MSNHIQAGGSVSKHLPHFEEREGQVAMLEAVQAAYEKEQVLLVEAGTGIGKSMAYLISAMEWAAHHLEPTVVATHTIALQEQLVQKDIPFLLDALGLDLRVVLLKGMSNYLCLRKLYDAKEEMPSAIMSWAETTKEGSKSELSQIDFFEEIGAEAESCTGSKCPHYKECFFFKARKKAAEAQLVIANHHLLFSDLAIRRATENYNEPCILPPFTRLIIDEAHHVEDVATEHFADRVSRVGLLRLLARLISDRGKGKIALLAKKVAEIPEEKRDEKTEELLHLLELTLVAEKREVVYLIGELFDRLHEFLRGKDKLRLQETHMLDPLWIERVQSSAALLLNRGRGFAQLLLGVEGKLSVNQMEGIITDIKGVARRFEQNLSVLVNFICQPLEKTRVRWIEESSTNLTLISAELEVAPLLKESLFDKISTVVLTSATLTANNDFGFMRRRLGIGVAEERQFESPFNYGDQVLLSSFIDLPDPTDPQFVSVCIEQIYELLQICRGNAFVLFTSFEMLRQCRDALQGRLPYPLLCQGEANRTHLLEEFRYSNGAVLFGTDSFWEGVDVVGDSLRCVILVKLPFKVPSDPLFQARSQLIQEQGGAAFKDYSLPQAALKFKQGFGRLIRHKQDRGAVICLDARLVNKGYGKVFLKSLPNCRKIFATRKEVYEELKKFYS
ncbi:MAG: ATP-dependent DNA helicase [Chlamydiales bacterium]